ncbi:MAG: hypothetical protein GY705_22280 [Bacteroidetes bacterium]|nr:hypothetical protein [Bacteroidota bacterium]
MFIAFACIGINAFFGDEYTFRSGLVAPREFAIIVGIISTFFSIAMLYFLFKSNNDEE